MARKVIKITRWYIHYNETMPLLRRGQYVYGLLASDRRGFDVIMSPRGERFVARAVKCGGSTDGKAYALVEDEDEWVELNEDEWPEEVCVALAKEALLGGVTEGDE